MSVETGRANQRRRTRKDLLQAAVRLMKQGRAPTLEEVAEEAMVSRATAYRYFPNIETLLIEAPLELAMRSPEEALRDAPELDPLARLERVEEMFQQMAAENEPALRMMVANATQRPLREEGELPARQNRRIPLIEAALAPEILQHALPRRALRRAFCNRHAIRAAVQIVVGNTHAGREGPRDASGSDMERPTTGQLTRSGGGCCLRFERSAGRFRHRFVRPSR